MRLTDIVKPEHLDKAAWTGPEFLGESFEDSVQRMLPYASLIEEAMKHSRQHNYPFEFATAMAMMNWIDRAIQIATLESRAARQ